MYLALLALSFVGVLETIYLIERRRKNQTPHCIFGKNCHVVLKSEYKSIFGIHLDVLGLIFYFVVAMISGIALYGFANNVLEYFLRLLVLSGAVFSIYLVFLQWRVIKHWCVRCVLSAFTTWAMAFVLLILE